MKKNLFLCFVVLLFGFVLSGVLSAEDKPATVENQQLYEAKLILIKAKDSKDLNEIQSGFLKAEAIINKDSRSLDGHKMKP